MDRKKSGSQACAVIALLHLASIGALAFPVEAGESLFASNEIFDLTVSVPLSKLKEQEPGASGVNGSLELDDGSSIPITCKKYGISRLRECQLASLECAVEAVDLRDTPFEGLQVLRLVPPCRLWGGHDKYTVLEYLVYRSYAVIAEAALRVRLVRVRFHDSEKRAKDETGYSFFVEDISHAASRGGWDWLSIESQQTSDLDAAQLTVMTIFQYMVGNTDWSAVKSRAGDRCCHNVAIFGRKGVDLNTVVPFDFDQTGLVNPPYAAMPDPSLGIQWVTDRKYRGFCEHNRELPAAIALFNKKRPELEALFNDERLPYAKIRAQRWKYIEGFYDTINNPRKLDKKIVRDCR